MRRLMSWAVSLRRSPSTLKSSWMVLRIFETSSSERSFTRVFLSTPAVSRIFCELGRPMPKMYVRPISTRLLGGRSTPLIRAILLNLYPLSLTLLVLRVLADDADHAGAPDHLALRADLLDGRTDFHGFLYLYL